MVKLDRSVKVILLDIEGTICPISFVKEVMYPASYTVLESVLSTSEAFPPAVLTPYLPAFPSDTTSNASTFLSHIRSLIASDSKVSEFKALQGYLWKTGFDDGTLRSPLFSDVLPTLREWQSEKSVKLAIFSSGSVAAQKLFLGHVAIDSEGGGKKSEDVNDLFEANFDTVNAGPKMEEGSYGKIAVEMGVKTEEVFFLSDNVKEVRAAIKSGMASFVVDRPGNAQLSKEDLKEFVIVRSLTEAELV